MGVGTLPRQRTVFALGQTDMGIRATMYRRDSGALAVERSPVFRSGTFRDSSGEQSTWEALHMKQMVDNYNHLRASNILTGVPVRDGHSGWLVHDLPGNGRVIGWHGKLYTEELVSPHDAVKYTYLLADFDVTDPHGAQQIANGTFRHRSAEIGPYRTNDEAEYWPVYMGVAYVDLPAVEGLQFSRQTSGPDAPRPQFVFMDGFTFTKEMAVTAGTQAPVLGVTNPAQSFSIRGVATTDPVAIQNHITVLEQFQAETMAAHRGAFVEELAAKNLILATAIPSMTEFAKGLSPEQFDAWRATFGAAPAASLTANHAGGTATSGGQAPAAPAAPGAQTDAQVAIDLEIVQMHSRGGMPKAQIEKTQSYTRLKAAGKLPANLA